MAEFIALALLLAAQSSSEFAVTGFAGPPRLQEESQAIQVLLVNELAGRGLSAERAGVGPCGDARCAAEVARTTQAPYVVVGSLQPFGEKIVVTAVVYEAGRGLLPDRFDITVDTASDLDVAAKRIASAIAGGGDTEQNQELGAITDIETDPDRRRRGRSSFTLSLGGVVPIDDTYGTSDGGLSIGVGYWYEGRNYAIETVIGLRFSGDTDGEREFYEVPLDIGVYYILGLGDFAPFIGGGGGLRWMSDARPGTIQVGSVITTVNDGQVEDNAFGFGGFVRGGVMLLRTYTVSLSISARYAINFMDLNDAGNPQAGLFEVQVYF